LQDRVAIRKARQQEVPAARQVGTEVVVVVVFIYPDLSPGGYAGYHNYLYLYV
jgi:hypothetical protein